MKTKTRKTPLVTAEAFGLTSCSSSLVPESKLSHRSEAQYGLVPRLSHHEWKNPASLENRFSPCETGTCVCAAGFLGFSFFKCEIPQGLMVRLQAFHRGACSPVESLQTQHQRRSLTLEERVFKVFINYSSFCTQ